MCIGSYSSSSWETIRNLLVMICVLLQHAVPFERFVWYSFCHWQNAVILSRDWGFGISSI